MAAVGDNGDAQGHPIAHLTSRRSAYGIATSGHCRAGWQGRFLGELGGDGHNNFVAFHQRGDLREILHIQNIAVTENDSAENRVFELAHVAGPGVGVQHGEGFWRNATNLAAFFGGKARDEMIHEGWNIIFAIAQRRHHHRIDIQPVIQIFAELAGLHHFNHVAVGRRNETDVHFDGFSRTNGVNFAFLDGAQKLDLHIKR